MKKYNYLIYLCFILCACSYNRNNLKQAFEAAGNNKEELTKVLEYYKNPEDSLKLRAAKFLIENMVTKYHVSNKDYVLNQNFFNDLDSLWEKKGGSSSKIYKDSELKAFLKEKWKIYSKPEQKDPKIKQDLQSITADYLIENIDIAFTTWKNPWAKHVSFDDFCEYILPYKVFNEPLENWRTQIVKDYYWIKDSVKLVFGRDSIIEKLKEIWKPEFETPIWNSVMEYNWIKNSNVSVVNPKIVAMAVNIHFQSQTRFSFNPMKDYPSIMTYNNIKKGRTGACPHMVSTGTMIMRGLGIPIAIDYVPAWANRDNRHIWCSVLHTDGKSYAFDAATIPHIRQENIIPGSIRYMRKAPKVFRKTYKNHENILLGKIKNTNDIPPELRNHNFVDVTNEYMLKTQDIKINLDKKNNESFAYLCVYNNRKWIPVYYGEIDKNNSVVFNDMGCGIVYLPAYYKEGQVIPAASPFIVTEGKKIRKLSTNKSKITLKLYRKFQARDQFKFLASTMVGGVFQGSNNPDFINAKTLYEIDKVPYPGENVAEIKFPGTFRYLRYYHEHPDNPRYNCVINELAFFGIKGNEQMETQLKGKIVAKDTIQAKKVFDVDILTNYRSWNRGKVFNWVGIDLGKGEDAQVTRIHFYPKNDGNSIEAGDTYELEYWDNEWKSLGYKEATDTCIEYENVPGNALYILHNHTKGKEERIFTYENGEQVWW